MWDKRWRDQIWPSLAEPWDVIIIGGGITGAGIFREAARLGLRTLLVDASDFASGTSSRSSKLVHGGFRYLKNAQIKLCLESVRERERLLKEGRGLINQLGFLLASYRGDSIPVWVFGAGLMIYDLLALKWNHRYYDAFDIKVLCPTIKEDKLLGGFRYFDAQTDDARLVLRLIQEGVQYGACALNYARVIGLLRRSNGQVCGIELQDEAPGGNFRCMEVRAEVVINATGAWADKLRQQIGGRERLRKLRGSHLVFSPSRLPISRAISFLHPQDRRPVFIIPWEGVSIIGTTDVDHRLDILEDPAISQQEVNYLLSAVRSIFPSLELQEKDIQCTYSGIRPVVDTGKEDPSKESREHILWQEQGLLTITGGKLTTFRLMAHTALQAVARRLPGRIKLEGQQRMLDLTPGEETINVDLSRAARLRLLGRFGAQAQSLVAAAHPEDLLPVGNTATLWAELRWAARSEGVIHLDDLLLRRVRLGLLLPEGGQNEMERIRHTTQLELGWDDDHWKMEEQAYTRLWKHSYSLS